jgi:hypothetical protein
MNGQEAFTKVWTGLKAQGFLRALGEGGTCAYRGTEGRRCAAGILIPDAEYRPEFESKTISQLVRLKQVPSLNDMSEDVRNVVQDCQWAHDDSITPADMEGNLRNVAARYKLTVPE